MGHAGLRHLPRRAAWLRHRPPGQPRILRPRRLQEPERPGRPAGVLPRFAGRHRQPHHHDQRGRRGRLGRRRHRGRGGDARPAGLHADARRGGLRAHRQIARRRDGHRPGAVRHGHPSQREGGRQVRRVLRPGRGVDRGARPRHHRQHGARIRRHHGLLPGGRDDGRLLQGHRSHRRRGRAVRGLLQGAGPLRHADAGAARIHQGRQAGSRYRHAERRRPQAAAGPDQPRPPFHPLLRAFQQAERCQRLQPAGREAACALPRGGGRAGTGRLGAATGGQRRRLAGHDRQRRCPDRGDHLVYQHLEPERDAGRRTARQEGGRGRLDGQAACQDFARTRFAHRDRLPREGGPVAVSREARLLPGGLRLHHLHRQCRRPDAGDQRSHFREQPDRRRGVVGQSQFRGPDPSEPEGELPGLAAAGGRLCDRRQRDGRPHDPAGRQGHRRQGRLPGRHLADHAGNRREPAARDECAVVPQELRADTGQPGCALEQHQGNGGRGLRLARVHLHRRAAVLRGFSDAAAGLGCRHPAGADHGAVRRLDHHRPHLAGRCDQGRLAGRHLAQGERRVEGGLQQLRLAARQPRRHDAGHLCQRAHQEPDAAGGRQWQPGGGRPHALPARQPEDVHLRRRDEVHRAGRADRDLRRRGIRHRFVARLGRQGHPAARHQGGGGPELRAHPPRQPGRHGRAAAPVPRSGLVADARPHGRGRSRRGDRRRPQAADGCQADHPARRRQPAGRDRSASHRHADRGRLLQARRHPALRAAPAARLRPRSRAARQVRLTGAGFKGIRLFLCRSRGFRE
ncbi:hypothetical protein VARIO8X_110229 [Burkholderiales bacterium 8X]|nr:hypothetical protein VARIO8X_110229 [Burkholderiales bacterium 8X]